MLPIAGFVMLIAFSIAVPFNVFASPSEGNSEPSEEGFVPDYVIVEGDYVNDDFGFGLTLPAGMHGFLWKSPDSSENKNYYMTIQIHPEFNSTEPSECCPTIDSVPAVMLLDSGPADSVSFVPFTGDLYAAVQGYNMTMGIERLDGTEVLAATLSAVDRDGSAEPPGRHLGKFYFINAGNDRFLSYGLWASEDKFKEYLDEFERSAHSMSIDNAAAIDLESVFGVYFASVPDIELAQQDGSSTTLHPELISPSGIEKVSLNQTTNTLIITVDGTSENPEFLIINSGKLLAGPHTVTVDGKPEESTVLRSGGDEFLFVVYDAQGPHKIAITGTAVVPEFGSGILLSAVAGIVLVIFFARQK